MNICEHMHREYSKIENVEVKDDACISSFNVSTSLCLPCLKSYYLFGRKILSRTFYHIVFIQN